MTDDIKAIRDALALNPSEGGEHIYSHPRDCNNWQANDAWHKAIHPERIARLLDALEAATKDAERYRWLKSASFGPVYLATNGEVTTATGIDAAIDAAMKGDA